VVGGRYALRTAIGHGGMGTVWRATDTLLRRDVAVKEVLLPPGLAPVDRDSMYQRTLREARAAAALSHPAVVQVYDVVTDGGRPWIVMELLNSRSLAEMIVEDGPLAPRAVAKIGIALLGALEVAHAAGVLHRDVKPANVLISSDGRCVLTDFGVARMPTDAELTSPGMVLGSPHFISPERAVGAAFGPPSDLFSLGVTLYTAVEGRPPFDKPDPFETMRAVVEEPPSPAMRAGALAGVLYGLLEKDPDRRWDVETARSVLRELLVGPLASNPTTHFTDPYAVVRPAPFTPPTAPPSGQIGGRAMLAPGESVSGALRRLGGPAGGGSPAAPPAFRRTGPDPANRAPAPPAPRRPVELDQTNPDGVPVTGHDLDVIPLGGRGAATTGRIPAQPGPAQPISAHPAAAQPVSAPGLGGPQPYQVPGGRSAGGRHAAPGGDAGRAGNVGAAARTAATAVAQTAASLATVARPAANRGWNTVRRLPVVARAGIATGCVLLLALGILGVAMLTGDDRPTVGRAGRAASPAAAGPIIDVQEHRDQRGFVVNVPKGWIKKPSSGSFIDYVDPTSEERRIRLNIESAGGTAASFAQVAEGYLRDRPAVCAAPYQRVALREKLQLGGQEAAELEYTCGGNGDGRHGIWRVAVQNGKAFHFFLTVPSSQFDASRTIYDEMVRSYRFGP
jgi:serine/threonine protein kinase